MVLKILFIDDDPFIRELMEGMLSIDGHTVELADEGRAGIAAFRAAKGRGEPFDVVSTDWAMPLVDGGEVIRTVKSEMPATPVILFTGWGEDIAKGVDITMKPDYVLNKPPILKKVQKALQEVLKI